MLSVLGLLCFVCAAVVPVIFPVFRLLEPTGPYPVGTMYFDLLDNTRPESSTPDENDHREFIVQVWYPAEPQLGAKPVAYLENAHIISAIWAKATRIFSSKGLPSFFFNHLSLVQSHAFRDAPVSRSQPLYPVLLFSHGYLSIVNQNTVQMEELASHGYIVFSISHTYEAAATFFSNGRIVPVDSNALDHYANTGQILDHLTKLHTRKDDIRFLIDELERINTCEKNSMFAGKLDLARLGIFGMSFGGTTAFEMCSVDNRCKAGIDLDGRSRPCTKTHLSVPFMFLLSEGNREYGPSCLASGDSVYVGTIQGSKHRNFCDLSLFSPVFRWGLMGRINGRRMLTILNAYTLAFFDKHLRGKDTPLLEESSPEYPEVEFHTSCTTGHRK